MTNENMNNPEQEVKNMDQEDKNQILESYDKFINYLGDQVSKGENLGMSQDQLAGAAKKVADYLAKNEDPKNREEKVLKELWNAASEENEKESLAKILVRLAQQSNG